MPFFYVAVWFMIIESKPYISDDDDILSIFQIISGQFWVKYIFNFLKSWKLKWYFFFLNSEFIHSFIHHDTINIVKSTRLSSNKSSVVFFSMAKFSYIKRKRFFGGCFKLNPQMINDSAISLWMIIINTFFSNLSFNAYLIFV